MLLDAGAEPSVKDANGDTPISWGSWHLRDADVLRLLIYEGVPGIRWSSDKAKQKTIMQDRPCDRWPGHDDYS